jgi:hypothetical protein
LVEITASTFGAWEIDAKVCKWLSVGIVEMRSVTSARIVPPPISSFTVNSLFKDLPTLVHSYFERRNLGAKNAQRGRRLWVRAKAATYKSNCVWITAPLRVDLLQRVHQAGDSAI